MARSLLNPLSLLRLPVEMLCNILAYLDMPDLLSCKRVCKTLRAVIHDSSRLQYIIELERRRMVSILPSSESPSYKVRLQLLRARERAWRHLVWKNRCTLDLGPTGSVYEFIGGIYGNGMEDDTRHPASISFLELPSVDSAAYVAPTVGAGAGPSGVSHGASTPATTRPRDPSSNRALWTHPMNGLMIIDFTMDPSEDLLVLVAHAPSDSKYVYEIHLRSLTTNTRHPKAPSDPLPCLKRPSLYTPPPPDSVGAVRVQVVGNLVALLIKEGVDQPGAHLEIWNWDSPGRPSCTLTSTSEIDDFTFLTQNAFLLVRNTGKFEVYTFISPSSLSSSTSSSSPILRASYHFPQLSEGYMYSYISMSSNPPPGYVPRYRPEEQGDDSEESEPEPEWEVEAEDHDRDGEDTLSFNSFHDTSVSSPDSATGANGDGEASTTQTSIPSPSASQSQSQHSPVSSSSSTASNTSRTTSTPKAKPKHPKRLPSPKQIYYPRPDDRIHAVCLYILNSSAEDTNLVHCFVFFINLGTLLNPPREWLGLTSGLNGTGLTTSSVAGPDAAGSGPMTSLYPLFPTFDSYMRADSSSTPSSSRASPSSLIYAAPNPSASILHSPRSAQASHGPSASSSRASPSIPARPRPRSQPSSRRTTPSPQPPPEPVPSAIDLASLPTSTAPYHIPWDIWGPQSTRWFEEGISTDWQHAVYGLRTVDSVPAKKVVVRNPKKERLRDERTQREWKKRMEKLEASFSAGEWPKDFLFSGIPGLGASGSGVGVASTTTHSQSLPPPPPQQQQQQQQDQQEERRFLRLRDFNPYNFASIVEDRTTGLGGGRKVVSRKPIVPPRLPRQDLEPKKRVRKHRERVQEWIESTSGRADKKGKGKATGATKRKDKGKGKASQTANDSPRTVRRNAKGKGKATSSRVVEMRRPTGWFTSKPSRHPGWGEDQDDLDIYDDPHPRSLDNDDEGDEGDYAADAESTMSSTSCPSDCSSCYTTDVSDIDADDFTYVPSQDPPPSDIHDPFLPRSYAGHIKYPWYVPRLVREPSATKVKGVFVHDIVSWLPYVEVMSEETFNITDVMMDDCRLLLLKRGATNKLEKVEVLMI